MILRVTLNFLVRCFKLTLSTQKSHAITARRLEFLEVRKRKWFSQRDTAMWFNRDIYQFETEVGRLKICASLLPCGFRTTPEVKHCLNIENFELSPRELVRDIALINFNCKWKCKSFDILSIGCTHFKKLRLDQRLMANSSPNLSDS